jgi:phage gp29-like protein
MPRSAPKGELARAAGSRDITTGFTEPLILQPHDPILRARGFDLRVYEELLRDDQVQSCFQQRRLATVSREWVVEAGGTKRADRKAAEFLEEQLERLRFDDLTSKMLYGLFYGWSVAECLWARDGAMIVPEDIKVRRRERFRWDRDGALRLLLPGEPQGEIMPDRKFWTFSAGGSTDDEPYGLGLGHFLYWPVFFKRNDLKAWLIFLEKFGAPTTIGRHPPGASDDEKSSLLAAAAAVATDAAVTIPETMALELLEASRGGTATYQAMLDAMDGAIAKVILSQTMTTDDGSSLSQAKVHEDVRDEVVQADADLVCSSFTRQVATWLTEWNFAGAVVPRVWRRMEDEPDLKDLAERDELLARIGWRPSEQRMRETYGEGYERLAPPEPPPETPPPAGPPAAEDRAPGNPAPAATLAEGERDSLDELADALADEWEPVIEPAFDALRQGLDEAPSLDAFRDRLPEILAGLDLDALAQRLARGRFAARLAGDADAPIRD